MRCHLISTDLSTIYTPSHLDPELVSISSSFHVVVILLCQILIYGKSFN